MADSDRVQGLADAFALLDGLPAGAQYELADDLGKIGRDLLAAQQAAAPKDTGNLAAGLTVQLLTEQLRVRVGFLGIKTSVNAKSNYGNLFYGIIVDKGRSAQTVVVERRARVNGRLRTLNGRKRLSDIVSVYTLNVRARDAVPFVELNDDLVDNIVDKRLADFWANAIARTGVPQ